MTCFSPKFCKLRTYSKIDEKTGEVYRTRRADFRVYADEKPQDYEVIPCGKCAGCREQQSQDWATRCMLEAQKWPVNSFLTLTYDDKHRNEHKSLCKRDLQLFFKKLRKAGYKFRYMAAGEYGPTTWREHYHICMFNFWPADAKLFSRREKNLFFTSEKIAKIWGKGFILITPFSYETAAYVARYTMKKTAKNYDELQNLHRLRGVEPEFRLTSRRPGLAAGTLKDFDIRQKIAVPSKDGVKFAPVPQYLRDKIKKENREQYYERSCEMTENAHIKTAELLKNTSQNWHNYFKKLGEIKREKLNRLDRFRQKL